jgi:Peptide methionine sulfoxide reductase
VLISRHKTKRVMPTEVLPGRGQPAFAVPEKHAVLGTPLRPPLPEGTSTAIFGLGCFWGAERRFWQIDGVYITAVGYAGASHRTRPTRRFAADEPGTPRLCSSSLTPKRSLTGNCSQCSGSPTTRRRGCARATTSARSIARRSTTLTTSSAGPPRRPARPTRRRLSVAVTAR